MERLVIKVKYPIRCNLCHIPYKKFPKMMVVSYLEADITWMDVFPNKNRISKTLSTIEIVLETPKIYVTHTTLHPVSYLNFKVKSRRMNSMKTRIMAETILRRSNGRGGH